MEGTNDEVGLFRCFLSIFFMSHRQERVFDSVTIALVGKYTDLKDSYMSVIKALEHSTLKVNRKLIIEVSVASSNFEFTFDIRAVG